MIDQLPAAILPSNRLLTAAEFQHLADVPPEIEEGVDTLGGLVTTLAGRVPARGETIKHPAGFDIEVLDADPRRVKRLRLRGLPPPVVEVEHV